MILKTLILEKVKNGFAFKQNSMMVSFRRKGLGCDNRCGFAPLAQAKLHR